MKKCNKCLDIKNLTDFPKNKRQNDGYSNICKECKKCKYILHREKNIEYQKKYNQKNKEKISTYNNFYQKEYRKHNKEKRKKTYLGHVGEPAEEGLGRLGLGLRLALLAGLGLLLEHLGKKERQK